MTEQQKSPSLAKEVVKQLSAFTTLTAGRAAMPPVDGLTEGIVGRLGVEASNEEAPFDEAMQALGLSDAGGLRASALELIHAPRQSPQPPATSVEPEEGALAEGGDEVAASSADQAGDEQDRQVDVVLLADIVYRLMRQDLAVEMERTR